MARQALRGAKLVPGASLRGLVFDSCYENCIPHTFGMLRHFGMSNRNRVLVSESATLNTVALAAALRVDESEVVARRYPVHGSGHRDFFGVHVMKRRIEDKVRRFSPAAIAKGILHHPATHELRDLPFSTVGWDLLHDRCPCTDDGVVQNWVTVNGSSRCHSCGGSLGRIAAVAVPEDLVAPLQFIAGLVDPDPTKQQAAFEMIPETIRGAGRTLLYDLIMNIARAVGVDADTEDSLARTAALAHACAAVMEWPTGLAAIAPSPDCPISVWEWVRRHYTILGACDPTPKVSTIPTPSGGGAVGAAYAPSGSAGRISSNLLSAMAAARLGGVDECALKQGWDEGRFTQHVWVHGTLRVRAFDPAEVVAVAPLLRISGARASAANQLGLPVYGVEQLIEQELFSPASPRVGFNQTAAHEFAAKQLVLEIEQARSVISDGVPFSEAMRHVSGRIKPWGMAIATMLDHGVPFDLREVGAALSIVRRLQVPRDAIKALIKMRDPESPNVVVEHAKYWTQRDALECLNGNVNAPELLHGLAWSGTPRKKQYLVSDVLHRASIGVTTADLSRRFGISVIRTSVILSAARVPQIAPGLWDRERGEATL